MDDIFFIARCPMCLEEKEFIFKFESTGVGNELFVREIFCETCAVTYQPEDKEEAEKLFKVAVYIKMLRSGEISEEDSVEEIESINSKVINDLLESSEMWNCPKCRELNYSTISECWKCQTVNPEFTEFLSELSEDEEGESLGAESAND